jgi:hypothetical protein
MVPSFFCKLPIREHVYLHQKEDINGSKVPFVNNGTMLHRKRPLGVTVKRIEAKREAYKQKSLKELILQASILELTI